MRGVVFVINFVATVYRLRIIKIQVPVCINPFQILATYVYSYISLFAIK